MYRRQCSDAFVRGVLRRSPERRVLGLSGSERGGDGRPSKIGLPRYRGRTYAQHAQQSAGRSRPGPAADLRPLERPAEQVVEDVLDDFIPPEHAREAYGVVLKSAAGGFAWALDATATEALRASMRG